MNIKSILRLSTIDHLANKLTWHEVLYPNHPMYDNSSRRGNSSCHRDRPQRTRLYTVETGTDNAIQGNMTNIEMFRVLRALAEAWVEGEQEWLDESYAWAAELGETL